MTQPYLSQLQRGAQKPLFLHRLTFPPPPCLGQAPAASKTATLCPQGSLSASQMNRSKCYRATGGEPQARGSGGPERAGDPAPAGLGSRALAPGKALL